MQSLLPVRIRNIELKLHLIYIFHNVLVVKAQNARLEEENVLLRHRLNRATTDHHTSATVNVESKIKAFQLEEERDRILETLQMHKKKYNKLHDAYLEKVKRCKALEEMFKRQKTLTGLVMKSAIAQRNTGETTICRHAAGSSYKDIYILSRATADAGEAPVTAKQKQRSGSRAAAGEAGQDASGA